MALRTGSFALTILLGLMTALGPLSTDMYLPSLPAIAQAFDARFSDVQLTLSAFLMGLSIGQIFYGPLSDRRGRKPVLLAGLALFLIATLLASLAPSVPVLILARFFQALGASGPIVLARAIVRDLYEGARAGQELSRMGTIMGVVPAIAPILGGFLEAGFGWRASFIASFSGALVLGLFIVFTLPETLAHRLRDVFSIRIVLSGYRALLRNGHYRIYVALSALTYSGLFVFISGATFVLQGYYGVSEIAFGFCFGSVVIGYVSGSFVAQRVVTRLGLNRTIQAGVALLVFGGVTMLGLVLLGPKTPFSVIIPMAFYTAGVGFTMPQAMAGAMAPFADRAGSASSLLGFIQMTAAACFGVFTGMLVPFGPLPLAALIALLSGLAFFVFWMARAFL